MTKGYFKADAFLINLYKQYYLQFNSSIAHYSLSFIIRYSV